MDTSVRRRLRRQRLSCAELRSSRPLGKLVGEASCLVPVGFSDPTEKLIGNRLDAPPPGIGADRVAEDELRGEHGWQARQVSNGRK